MWSSIDPANKVPVNTTDGSYSLQVANHTGSFTITAEYTAADGKYKTSTAKTVTTKGASIENQDIALEYGYTTEVIAKASLNMNTTSGGRISSGVTIVITAEDGHEVGRGITSGAVGPSAVIPVDHPGRILITASRDGYRGDTTNSERLNISTTVRSFSYTFYLYQNVP